MPLVLIRRSGRHDRLTGSGTCRGPRHAGGLCTFAVHAVFSAWAIFVSWSNDPVPATTVVEPSVFRSTSAS